MKYDLCLNIVGGVNRRAEAKQEQQTDVNVNSELGKMKDIKVNILTSLCQ